MVRWLAGLLFPLSLQAQFTYTIDQSVSVKVGEAFLSNAWAGGLNAAQFNTMDLNADGFADLVIFDKTTSKISTFIAADNAYRYAPEYESRFPAEISTFVVLRDFNCDGKKDLFTFGQIGVFVFRNDTQPGQPLTWKKLSFFNPITMLKSEVLLTTGFSGKINLLPGTNDLPDFRDMDGDGDLDMMNMRFVSPSTAEYHKNFSMERYGKCDSLDLERQTQNWGGFEECSCGQIAFGGLDCSQLGGRTEEIEHTGGKALLSLDVDNDGDRDLLFTEESCSQLYLLHNGGTPTTPNLTGLSFFPASNPVNIQSFPAPYLEDIDFDNKPDLLVSPNMYARTSLTNNFRESIWMYKNTGTTQAPVFSFVKKNFLQDTMFDFGDFSAPALFDVDQDGDEDLFVGRYIDDNLRSSISYYKNTGTALSPSFEFITDDFLALSYLAFYNFKPQFVDFDANGSPDLFFTATNLINGRTNIFFVPSSGTSAFSPSGDLITINVSIDPTENATAIDIDLDGHVDLLIGTNTGSLEYWRNTGTAYRFVLANNKFMGLASSPLRQNLSAVAGDLDADGYDDLLIGDQAGHLSVYGDFRSTGASPQPVTDIVYNTFTQTYGSWNLGGRLKPFVTHVLGSNKPEIMVGNSSGGLYLLKNDNGEALSDEPSVTVFPNPLPPGESLSVMTDRNARMEIFTMLGQRIGSSLFVTAHQILDYPLQGVSPGIYIARFTIGSKTVSRRFIIL